MSGYHFFAEIGPGQWHRTEDKGEPGGPPVKCSCGISNQDPRVLKLRDHFDTSWQWCPPQAVAKCFPTEMRFPKLGKPVRLPTDHDGVPMCSHIVCPQYNAYSGKCSELIGMPTDVCIPEVRDMALNLDAHEDASTPAFDEIAVLCGVPEWEYPGQVVRDVQLVVKERDELRDLLVEVTEKLYKNQAEHNVQLQAMRSCIVYARDRRGGTFDFDDWHKMVEYALRVGDVPPHALEDAQAQEAKAWAAVTKIREERDLDLHAMTRQGKCIDELREKLRIAEAVRDDARAASQRYLDEKRAIQERYDAQCEDQRRTTLALKFSSSECRDNHCLISDVESDKAGLVFQLTESDKTISKIITERNGALDRIQRLLALNETLRDEKPTVAEMEAVTAQKDGAYTERDRCVAGLAALAVRLGWNAWLGKHPPDPKWDAEWMTIVFINLPTGQVSWHIHDREVEWFSFLPTMTTRPWDGHSTAEKYERLAKIAPDPERAIGYEPPPPLNVACPVCQAKIGDQCVFIGTGIVMGGGGMCHRERANLVGVDLKPVEDTERELRNQLGEAFIAGFHQGYDAEPGSGGPGARFEKWLAGRKTT